MKWTAFLSLFFYFLLGCQTHREILDQGGTINYKEKGFVSIEETKTPSSDSNLSLIQRRLDLLERNSVDKEELDKSIDVLKQEVEKLSVRMDQFYKNKPEVSAESNKPEEKQDLFSEAEKNFSEKKWKDAILTYEKFRTQEPSSPHFKVATLKIGRSFIELGYPQESQVFLKEVTDRFPNSPEAKEAQQLLDSNK